MLQVYLPVAEISVNLLLMLVLGAAIDFLLVVIGVGSRVVMRQSLYLSLVASLLLPGLEASQPSERPEQVQSDISTREISIQSNFTGIEIVLFGSIDFSRRRLRMKGPTMSS